MASTKNVSHTGSQMVLFVHNHRQIIILQHFTAAASSYNEKSGNCRQIALMHKSKANSICHNQVDCTPHNIICFQQYGFWKRNRECGTMLNNCNLCEHDSVPDSSGNAKTQLYKFCLVSSSVLYEVKDKVHEKEFIAQFLIGFWVRMTRQRLQSLTRSPSLFRWPRFALARKHNVKCEEENSTIVQLPFVQSEWISHLLMLQGVLEFLCHVNSYTITHARLWFVPVIIYMTSPVVVFRTSPE